MHVEDDDPCVRPGFQKPLHNGRHEVRLALSGGAEHREVTGEQGVDADVHRNRGCRYGLTEVDRGPIL